MEIREITDANQPELALFGSLTEAQLRNRLEPERGVFIAESPKVIGTALAAGCRPVALLCERRHIAGDARDVIARCGEGVPVYTGERETLRGLTGYRLTRGVLCAMRRPPERSAAEVCRGARRVAVLHGIADTTNVGAIFRSAAALGLDAVLLTPDTCDPLNRRAVRVSMGSVLLVPWARIGGEAELADMGFRTAAMALRCDDMEIGSPALRAVPRLAVVLGTEGDGLPQAVIEAADYVVRIPMRHGVDSLNVGAAAAIAFWELTR